MKLKVGTRQSRLALIQTQAAVERLQGLLPGITLEIAPMSSPGDRDRVMDLRESSENFFTRDLDEALLSGEIDLALHSAKDVPDPVRDGLDWSWLPWREDPRDVLVLAEGKQIADLPPTPRIGVSSDRRERYCRDRFPTGRLATIRGNIEERLKQLDEGDYDLVIMAAAALLRMDHADRIGEWIPLDDLPSPDGQGALAMTFRADDTRLLRLRSLLVKAVTFVGAGIGSTDLCTVGAVEALARADVCLHDALLDQSLLGHLPPSALRIDVGKRAGAHRREQDDINTLLARHARRGQRVVRLKGGDPGIFGRLAEEVVTLEGLRLPFRVIPGISSLNAATTGTGMLLTRRGVSRGFCAMSAREKGGKTADVSRDARAQLPCVFFMGAGVVSDLVAQQLAEGVPGHTPAAMVFNAGAEDEHVLRAPLDRIAAVLASTRDNATTPPPPALFIVGAPARHAFAPDTGALLGHRILLTCSEALLTRAADAVRDLGGRPIPFPLVKLTPAENARDIVARIKDYDWIALTSPSAVRLLFRELKRSASDIRTIPRIMVSGSATADELVKLGLIADLCPVAGFGAQGLLDAAPKQLTTGARVLRLRSDVAGPGLSTALRARGLHVDDVELYRNTPIPRDRLPEFDSAFFASSSAVRAFMRCWSAEELAGKVTAAIGLPTARELKKHRVRATVVPHEATVAAGMLALGGHLVAAAIEEES